MNKFNVTFIRHDDALVANVPCVNEEKDVLLGGGLVDPRLGRLEVDIKTGTLVLRSNCANDSLTAECRLHYI